MADSEEVLGGSGLTHVVRVGQTVRRPARRFTPSVQAYLRHVRSRGIDFVPEPLGYDEQGREVLSFMAGEVPVEPLPDWATSDEVLVALAGLIRRLHDASDGWEPPAGAVWGSLPGESEAALTPLFERPDLVSHQDYCPGNVVFRDARPIALIDFDLARPTTRVADCVNALYWWAPLMDPLDRAPSLREVDAAPRVRCFADAYGMDKRQREEIVAMAVRRTRNSYFTMRAAAAVDPVFKRWWDEGVKERIPRTEQWLFQERESIEAALLA
ncbi:MAG: aminoglycoside phosphotransferase family protein [Actinomycetota bacterium]|nr:aminoglycoside phosphotransferase family protein [Actinomycetota bacterium]